MLARMLCCAVQALWRQGCYRAILPSCASQGPVPYTGPSRTCDMPGRGGLGQPDTLLRTKSELDMPARLLPGCASAVSAAKSADVLARPVPAKRLAPAYRAHVRMKPPNPPATSPHLHMTCRIQRMPHSAARGVC